MSQIRRLFVAFPLIAAVACGGEVKDKVELDSDLETSYAAASADGFTEVEGAEAESAHPYRNFTDQRWTIRGSENAVQLKIVFDRFELENGYDFLTITPAEGEPSRHTGSKTGREVLVDGNSAQLRLQTDYSVTKWGFKVSVYEKTACVCPEIFRPVCGADGATYSNSCMAGCSGIDVQHDGECRNDWFEVGRVLQSAHPYRNDFDNTWTIKEAGARLIRGHFARIDVERGYDFVRVLDGNDRVVAEYTGTHVDVTTPAVTGDTLKVRLVTDYSVTRYGFQLDRYDVQGGCSSNADCSSGNECVQVQCVRAPCFASCQPVRGGSYRRVTVEQLNNTPERFDGRQIRVTAEPTVLARCTRRGCTQSNPCCNTCSGNFQLDGNIELSGAAGDAWGCSGNECNYQNQCQPLPTAQNGGQYTFEGTFAVNGNFKSIRVDRFRAADCAARGCSNQVCANAPVVTTCDFRPEYQCYRTASCEAQSDGLCGWTQTPALQMCIDDARGGGPVTVSGRNTPAAIPDNNEAGVTTEANVRNAGTVQTARLTVQITHTYRGDLRVTLVAPDGSRAVVHDQEGGSQDDLFLDNITVPEMAGLNGDGTWKLIVQDRARLDTGRVESWSLTLE